MARNPPWEEKELVLALDVYFRFPEARQSKAHPQISQLSRDLRGLRLPIERPDPEKFRNVNGAFLKLQNLKALDPEYTAGGRVGMTAGATRREQALWDRYATNPHGAEWEERDPSLAGGWICVCSDRSTGQPPSDSLKRNATHFALIPRSWSAD